LYCHIAQEVIMEISKSDRELAAEAAHQREELERWNSLSPEEQAEALRRAEANLPPLGGSEQA
jgi:hypothetical protein